MSKSARYRGKPGSKKWRGFTKVYIRDGVNKWNELLELVESDYRIKIVKKPKEKNGT